MKQAFHLGTVLLNLLIVLTSCQPSQDEIAIKHLLQAYVEAYNAHDAQKLISLWAENGIFIDLNTMEKVQGPNRLEHFYKDQFEKIKTLHLLSYNTYFNNQMAFTEGRIQLQDKKQAESLFKITYSKNKDTWQIQSFIQLVDKPSHSNSENLKELDWMVGNWVSHDPLTQRSTNVSFKWDSHKNFLLQDAHMKLLGENDLDIHQIIGWDPEKNQIRSWTFDSDGSFAQGVWSRKGNTWYVKTDFTINSGEKGSSIDTYTKENNETYYFSSIERVIENNKHSDIGPFKFIRD